MKLQSIQNNTSVTKNQEPICNFSVIEAVTNFSFKQHAVCQAPWET